MGLLSHLRNAVHRGANWCKSVHAGASSPTEPLGLLPQFRIANEQEIAPRRTAAGAISYFLSALRAIVLKGVGVEVFWRDLLALSVFATAVLGLAARHVSTQSNKHYSTPTPDNLLS